MSALLLNLALSALTALTLVTPFFGALLYFWLGIMNPHQITYGGTSIRWTLIVSIVMLVSIFISKDRFKIPWNSLLVLLTTLFLWTCFTTLFAQFAETAHAILFDFMKTIIVTFCVVALTTTRERLNILVWVLVASASVYILREGAYVILSGGNHLVLGPPRSPFYGNNDLSRMIGMALPFALFFSFHASSPLMRKFALLITTFAVITIVGSQSRGALVAMGGMAGYLFLRSNRKAALSLLTVFIGVLFITIVDQNAAERLTSRYSTIDEYDTDLSFQGRVFAWSYATDTIISDSPIVGHGFGAFRGATMHGTGDITTSKGLKKHWIDAHSIYYEALGEHGIIGLLLFVLLGLTAFFKGRQLEKIAARSYKTYWERDLAVACQACLIFYFIGGAVISHTYMEIYYLVLAFIIVLDRILNKTSDKNEPSHKRST